MVVYTSEDAHYSVKKMAVLQGIGSDNVYLIKTDARGKMDVKDLEAQIQRTLAEDAVPFMVSATAGKTLCFYELQTCFLLFYQHATVLKLFTSIPFLIW